MGAEESVTRTVGRRKLGMSRIFRCDRCGMHYDKRPDPEKSWVVCPHNMNRTPLDLCQECTDQLERWLNMSVRNYEGLTMTRLIDAENEKEVQDNGKAD